MDLKVPLYKAREAVYLETVRICHVGGRAVWGVHHTEEHREGEVVQYRVVYLLAVGGHREGALYVGGLVRVEGPFEGAAAGVGDLVRVGAAADVGGLVRVRAAAGVGGLVRVWSPFEGVAAGVEDPVRVWSPFEGAAAGVGGLVRVWGPFEGAAACVGDPVRVWGPFEGAAACVGGPF